jgi:hypothetical protein
MSVGGGITQAHTRWSMRAEGVVREIRHVLTPIGAGMDFGSSHMTGLRMTGQ